MKNEELDREFTSYDDVSHDMAIYQCTNCAGEIIVPKTTMATVCPYCGEAVSITSKIVGNFRPKYCIPFSKNKEQAMKAYKKYLRLAILTPKLFKEKGTIEKIQGLFTPFYLHDIELHSMFTFHGNQHTTKHYDGRSYVVRDIYDLRTELSGKFEKIPTDASYRIDNHLMDCLEPFNYDELTKFNPAYMAGYIAEQKDDDTIERQNRAVKRAQKVMREKAQSLFKKYNDTKLMNEDYHVLDHESSYAMLPVWIFSVKYKKKIYTFAVNGQTGKVVGKLPIHKLKFVLIVLLSYLLTLAGFWLYNMSLQYFLALIAPIIIGGGLLLDHNYNNKSSSKRYMDHDSFRIINKEETLIDQEIVN